MWGATMGWKKRVYYSIRLLFIKNSKKRADFVKKKGIYNGVGNNVRIMPRKIPLYPQLIRFHNNVRIASDVSFVTHDNIHYLLRNKYKNRQFLEKIGCIEIMDNVFIGSNCQIMYDVRIGPNAIVAAGSVVTKDVPENSIVAGVPAKVIGSFDKYVERIKETNSYPVDLSPNGQKISQKLVELQWQAFESKRNKTNIKGEFNV